LRPYVGGNPGAIKDPYVREAIQSLHQYALQLNQVVGFKPTVTNTTTTVTNTIVQPGGVTAHSQLTGLLAPADDHKQYLLLSGRVGGQIAYGGLNTANTLVLRGNPVVVQPINAGLTLSNGYASSPIALISDEANYISGGYTLLMLQFTSSNTSGAGGGARLFCIRNTVGADDIFSVIGYSTSTAVVRTGGLSLTGFGSGATLTTLAVNPPAASVGMTITAASGATADLLRINYFGGGSSSVKVAVDGQVTLASATTAGTLNILWNAGGTVLSLGTAGSSAVMKFLPNSTYMPITCDKITSFTSPGLTLVGNTAANISLTVRGAAAQTANLQEWQNSGGVATSYVAPTGTFFTSTAALNNATALLADLQYQNTSGSVQNLLRIRNTAGGGTAFNAVEMGGGQTNGYLSVGTQTSGALFGVGASGVSVNSGGAAGAANVPLVVGGSSGQTAALQEWRNSGGTVLSSVTKDGYISSKQLLLNGATSGTLTIVPTAATTSHTWTLPAAQGGASTVLTNDGAGTLSWAATNTLLAWPIGSIFMSVSHTTGADVATALGGGTWAALGQGRVLIGVGSNGTTTYANGDSGGVETVTLTAAQSGIPAHSHTITDPGHFHVLTGGATDDTVAPYAGVDAATTAAAVIGGGTDTATTGISVDNSTAAGAASSHTNLQPYFAVYMWKRTA
jgi:hypothetical protein